MENANKNNKAVIYARVSSKEQEDAGYSLDAQVTLLEAYGQKNEIAIKKIFKISESASGKQIRKTFNEMLDYASKNNVLTILCEKIDRLTRSPKDAGIISDWITENTEREIHFVKESFILNKNTKAHESLVWNMKVAIARFYIDNLSEEVKKGQKEKIAQGEFPQRAKAGYKTIGEKGRKSHVIDEVMGPLMARTFELYATGNYSLKAITETITKEGLRSVAGGKIVISRIHQLLSDPYYYGIITWNGVQSPGKHEPLISKDLFDAVQGIMSRKRANPSFKKHLPVFKAKIQCDECGGLITWETQKGHWYGHCNHYKKCSQRTYLRQEKVEDQLFPLFDNVAPKNERVLKILEKALRESHDDEIEHNTLRRNEFTRTIQTADKRYENAYRDKLDGKMSMELCQKMMDESAKEKEDAVIALKKLGESRAAYYEAGLAIHELALKASEIYKCPEASTEEKRLLLSHIFSNLTLNADKIRPNYTLGFEFMSEWMPRINSTFELAESGSIKGKRDAFASLHPIVLRR